MTPNMQGPGIIDGAMPGAAPQTQPKAQPAQGDPLFTWQSNRSPLIVQRCAMIIVRGAVLACVPGVKAQSVQRLTSHRPHAKPEVPAIEPRTQPSYLDRWVCRRDGAPGPSPKERGPSSVALDPYRRQYP